MTSQMPGAGLRATLAAAAVLAPSTLVGHAAAGAAEVVVLVAALAALLTFAEYAAPAPVLVDFRAAPPVNRFRFAMVAATATALAVASGGAEAGASTLARLTAAVGLLLGTAMDLPGSPVRVVLATLPDTAAPAQAQALRAAAGLGYLAGLVALTLYAIALRVRGWPDAPDRFNLWVNLPNLPVGAGDEAVRRLRRAGAVNLSLAIAAAYLGPPVAAWLGSGSGALAQDGALLLVWAMTAWASVPTILLMRAIALRRLAAMVALRLRRLGAGGAGEDPAFLPA